MESVINLVSSDEEDNDGSIKDRVKQNKGLIIKKLPSNVPQNVKDIPKQKFTPSILQQKKFKNNNTSIKQITVIHTNKQQNERLPSLPKSQQTSLLAKSQQLPSTPKSQHSYSVLKSPQSPAVPKGPQSPSVLKSQQSSLLIKNQQSSSQLSPSLSRQQPSSLIISAVKSVRDEKTTGKKRIPLSLASGITITPVNRSAVTANNHSNTTPSHVGSVTIKPRTDTVTIVSKPTVSPTTDKQQSVKSTSAAITKPAKRVIPTKISDTVTMRASSMEKSSDSDMLSRDSSSIANDEVVHTNETNGTNPTDEYKHTAKRPKIVENEKRPMHDDYVHLIEVCKSVDRTEDMKKIGAKLEKYYYKAHPDYVNSKSFHRLVQSVISEIQAEPKLVYMKIKNLLEELKTRQPTEGVNMATAEDPEQSEADKKKTIRIQRLSEALCSLQRRIKKCEEAEVDWDDENNSKYLMTERFKQRACDIYNKLCDLTGESRSAERIVKKPIKFIGTSYPEFNRKLEKFINETKAFPDMFDVLRIMDHCSKHYNYRLNVSERKIVAQDAFHQVGTLLQKRRKADLYEMVQYFSGNQSDPAGEDPQLKSKLEENQRHYSKRMREVIEKFTKQNHNDSEGNDEDESPVKAREKPKVEVTSRSPSPSPSPLVSMDATLEPSEMNVDATIDLLNDSVINISDGVDFNDISKSDTILIDEDDVNELEREFYPTIKSVTSLNPNEFNDLMNFESGQMEGVEIS